MTNYTSAELAVLAEEIPTKIMKRGLLYLEAAEFVKPADIQFDAATVSLDDALNVAVATHAPFVSLEVNKFDPDKLRGILATEEGRELPTKVKQLLLDASSHSGEVDVLWLRWLAQGIIFEWNNSCEWRDTLSSSLADTSAEADEELTLESINREYSQMIKTKEFAAVLIMSTDFRGTPANRRFPVAQSIISSTTSEEIESGVIRQAASEAGQVAERRIYEYEGKLKQEIQELAVELRGSDDWRIATTVQRRREITQLFLAEKAEGYRVGPRIVDQVLDAARNDVMDK